MGYEKTNWVTGQTPLSADNFNHMEEGIANNANNLSAFLMVKKQSVTKSISAGSDSASKGFSFTSTVTSYTGYTPLGVIGWENNHALTCMIGEISLVGNSIHAYGANQGSATSLTIDFYILYMKNIT